MWRNCVCSNRFCSELQLWECGIIICTGVFIKLFHRMMLSALKTTFLPLQLAYILLISYVVLSLLRIMAVPWLGWLVPDLAPWRPRFSPRALHVESVMESTSMGQIFSPDYYSTSALYLSTFSSVRQTLYPLESAFPSNIMSFYQEFKRIFKYKTLKQ